jgi:tyrosyl-tRNA synthetase
MSNQKEVHKLYEKFQNTVWVADEDPTGQKEMYEKMKEKEDEHVKKYNELINLRRREIEKEYNKMCEEKEYNKMCEDE